MVTHGHSQSWYPRTEVSDQVALGTACQCGGTKCEKSMLGHCLDDLRPDPVGITMTINDLHNLTYTLMIPTYINSLVASMSEWFGIWALFSPLGYSGWSNERYGGNNHTGKGFVNRYHLSLSLGVALYRWASFNPTILVIESSWGLGWNGCPISK